MSYYHGGVTGLVVGDFILPPAETGVVSCQDLDHPDTAMQAQIEAVHRRDRVYLTTELLAASMFAALHPGFCCHLGGAVYEVAPIGDIEPDADYLQADGGSVCAPKALITRVVVRAVPRDRILDALGISR